MQDEAEYDEPEESCDMSDDTNQLVVAKYCEIDPETGSFSPAPSASGAVTAETALLGASLAAGLAALA